MQTPITPGGFDAGRQPDERTARLLDLVALILDVVDPVTLDEWERESALAAAAGA